MSYSSPVHKKYQESNESDNDSSSNSDTGSTGTYIIERNDIKSDKSEQSTNFDDNNDDFKKSNSMVKVLGLLLISCIKSHLCYLFVFRNYGQVGSMNGIQS